MRTDELRVLFAKFGGAGIDAGFLYGEPMSGHTSLGLGGAVDVLVSPKDESALAWVLKEASRAGAPILPLGGGTNLLVGDGGLEGVAVGVGFARGLEALEDEDGREVLRLGAGLSLGKLVGYAREKGLSGVEGLAGIPGTLGGAVAGNAGSFGAEMKDVVRSVRVMDSGGEIGVLKASALVFGYRSASLPAGAIVLGMDVALLRDDPHAVAGRTKSAHDKKKATQPLYERSAGCVFKNPPGRSAGELIDKAGCKGMRVGGIEVGRLHANFFLNRGGGRTADFLALMERVSGRVRDAFGLELVPEIKVVGRC